jgi:hypothetical protein
MIIRVTALEAGDGSMIRETKRRPVKLQLVRPGGEKATASLRVSVRVFVHSSNRDCSLCKLRLGWSF